MERRIVWIHGIGPHRPGYSAAWQRIFDPYLKLPAASYLEVCWNTVFEVVERAMRSLERTSALTLSAEEQAVEAEVRADLETILLARASALAEAQPEVRTRGINDRVVEWAEISGERRTRSSLAWLFNPDEYLGDFTKYIVSRRVRNAVKEQAKAQLRSYAGSDVQISIVAHSWGTVVAYESLLDLAAELPDLNVRNMITLGSPLWLVRPFLDDRSGDKPRNTTTWINVHARGDLIGSWLSQGFDVDKEFQVPNFGGAGAHSSYFVEHNEAVQRDIVAQAVLQ